MEFPFGHSSHTRHHRRDDDDDDSRRGDYPPPPPDFNPPPPYSQNEFAPPPPPPPYSRNEYAPPPPPYSRNEYAPPPPPYSRNEYAPPPPQRPSYQDPDDYAPPPPTANNVYHTSHRQEPDFSYNYQGSDSYAPPPPPPSATTHVYHTSHNQDPGFSHNYQGSDEYTPPPTQVAHVSHESAETHHSYRPHIPSFIHQQTHESGFSEFSNKPTYKVYSKAEPNYLLTIREGKVILAAANPSDEFQHWYKDEKYSTRVKDEEGCPAFALVNKATGQSVKHSIGASHPVQLIPYNPDRLDESVLWTQSRDLGDSYRTIRMVNNVHLNVDAFHGDERSGGVHDGTTIVLWKWNKGVNQRWKIIPHFAPTTSHVRQEPDYLHSKPTFKVFCKADPHYLLSIRDGKQSNPASVFQHWYKDERYSATVKDERGRRAFSLVNKGTGQALKHSIGASHPVQLKVYNGDVVDESVLWVMGCLVRDGFRSVRMVNNVRLILKGMRKTVASTTAFLFCSGNGTKDNQRGGFVHIENATTLCYSCFRF